MRKEYRRNRAKERFFKYMRKTWKNKLYAIAMLIPGVLGVVVLEDATALLFIGFIAVPMFFSKEIWIY